MLVVPNTHRMMIQGNDESVITPKWMRVKNKFQVFSLNFNSFDSAVSEMRISWHDNSVVLCNGKFPLMLVHSLNPLTKNLVKTMSKIETGLNYAKINKRYKYMSWTNLYVDRIVIYVSRNLNVSTSRTQYFSSDLSEYSFYV